MNSIQPNAVHKGQQQKYYIGDDECTLISRRKVYQVGATIRAVGRDNSAYV